jgi:hypothetical protein
VQGQADLDNQYLYKWCFTVPLKWMNMVSVCILPPFLLLDFLIPTVFSALFLVTCFSNICCISMPSWTSVLCHGDDKLFCTIHKNHSQQTQPYTVCSVDISSTGFSFQCSLHSYNQKWCYALHGYNQMCLDLTLQFSSFLFHFIMPQVS